MTGQPPLYIQSSRLQIAMSPDVQDHQDTAISGAPGVTACYPGHQTQVHWACMDLSWRSRVRCLAGLGSRGWDAEVRLGGGGEVAGEGRMRVNCRVQAPPSSDGCFVLFFVCLFSYKHLFLYRGLQHAYSILMFTSEKQVERCGRSVVGTPQYDR